MARKEAEEDDELDGPSLLLQAMEERDSVGDKRMMKATPKVSVKTE